MKKKIAVLAGVLCLTVFAACGGQPGSSSIPNMTEGQKQEETVPGTPVKPEEQGNPAEESQQAAAVPEKSILDEDHGEVSSLEVEVLPEKTDYLTGEDFTAAGGQVRITFADGASGLVSMEDSRLEVSTPNTARAGTKNVTVKYGGKKVNFKIEVSIEGLTVTYVLDAETKQEESMDKGTKIKNILAPEKNGAVFYNWYADEACTQLYDFDQPIMENTEIYASWKEDGASYHTVTFDFNYYGSVASDLVQIVKDGEAVRVPGVVPERQEYAFGGWFEDAGQTTALAEGKTATEDLTIYAGWTREKNGSSLYVFEAEDVDLTGKSGPGYSGENAGVGMIVTNKDIKASQDKFVAYQCRNGNSLEFYLASDKETDEAELILSLAAEFAEMELDPSMYEISVNGEPLSYSPISLKLTENSQQGLFADYSIGKVHLKEGTNLIMLKTTNSTPLGGTLTATAPIIDCVKLQTEAVVFWDGNYGLPKENY